MLILASQSSARAALLSGAGLAFSARPAGIDERFIETRARENGADLEAIAVILAVEKARAISLANPDAWVISADQTLAFADAIVHKPRDRAEARAQLLSLRAETHRLHSGVALARDGDVVWATAGTASLTMRAFSDAELDAVLALDGDRVLESGGGYRLEGPAVRLFSAIEGDYFTILGLPLLALLDALRKFAPETFEDRTSEVGL